MSRFGADMNGVEETQGSVEGQARMRTQNGIWQGEYPVLDGACFAIQPEDRCSLLHQGGGQRIVRCGQRVRNGFAPFALRLIPARCPGVQERHQFRVSRVQTSTQRLAKQIMVAIPVPVLIERHHKEIGPFHFLQHVLA